MFTFLNPNKSPNRLVFRGKGPETQAEAPKAPENKEKSSALAKAQESIVRNQDKAIAAAQKLGMSIDINNVTLTGKPEVDRYLIPMHEALIKVRKLTRKVTAKESKEKGIKYLSMTTNQALQLAREFEFLRGVKKDPTPQERAKFERNILSLLKGQKLERGVTYTHKAVGALLVQRSMEGKPDGYMVVLGQAGGQADVEVGYFGSTSNEIDFALNDNDMRNQKLDQMSSEA